MSPPPHLLRPLKRALPLHRYSKRDHLEDRPHGYWYWSSEAAAIKYGIFFGILALFFVLLMVSWFHAKKRLQRGQAPMRYHRWLVARSQRNGPTATGPENNFTFYQSNQEAYGPGAGYGMNPMPPPPAYNPNFQQPPSYEPQAPGAGPMGGKNAQPPPPPPMGASHNPFLDPAGPSGTTPPPPVAGNPGYVVNAQGGRYA